MSEAVEQLTCEEAFRMLDDYLDRSLAEEDLLGLKKHLSQCEVCLGEYRFEDSLLDEVRSKLNDIKAPDDLMNHLRRILETNKK